MMHEKDDDSLVEVETTYDFDDDEEVEVVASTSNDADDVVVSSQPIPAPSVAAAASSMIEKIPSSATSREEEGQRVEDVSYDTSISTTQEDDNTSTAIKSIRQLSRSMRSGLLHEGKSPTWREDWLGVHLPPSAVIRAAPTIVEEEVLDSLPNQNDKEDDGAIEEEEEVDSEIVIPVEELPPPPKQTVPTIVNTAPPPDSFSLSSLLNSPGPSIPLYPLLLLLTTIYILKQTFHILFGFKSRTRVTRSMTRVLLNKKQFVIPKDQLLQHIEWMKLRNDLRRMREKNRKKMQGVKNGGGLDENDEGGGHDSSGGGEGGSSGMNRSSGGDNSSKGSGGGHYDDTDGDDRADNSHNTYSDNGSGQEYANYSSNSSFEQWMVDQELPKSLDLEQFMSDNTCAAKKILMLKQFLTEVMEKKDGETAMLKSAIEAKERAIQESSERASAFESHCKEMQEQVASLKEEVAVLELVCEKMCSSGDGDDELEGLEIDGANCLRSCLGSLTNMNEEDEYSDSEWDRMEEENKLLRAENGLLQESLDCVRKELDEARADARDAAKLSEELKDGKTTQRERSSINDLTNETTDESFDCLDISDSIPLFVEGAKSMTDSPLSSSTSSTNAIHLLLKKYAHGTRQVSGDDDNPIQDLNQDLLDLLQLMANFRKLDGDNTTENARANSPRKRGRTRGCGTLRRGRSRHRTSTKERSKILTKSRLTRIREKSISRRDTT